MWPDRPQRGLVPTCLRCDTRACDGSLQVGALARPTLRGARARPAAPSPPASRPRKRPGGGDAPAGCAPVGSGRRFRLLHMRAGVTAAAAAAAATRAATPPPAPAAQAPPCRPLSAPDGGPFRRIWARTRRACGRGWAGRPLGGGGSGHRASRWRRGGRSNGRMGGVQPQVGPGSEPEGGFHSACMGAGTD
eukprot:scaffold2911_cov414-Prasinococcus_capsulatus_cf.AAC.2